MSAAPPYEALSGPAGARSGRPWRRMLLPAMTVGTLALATIALHVRDPHDQGSWGICPTKALFGVSCPGCGGLRAVNDLSNFKILDAASSNLLFVASLPLIAYVFARWSIGRWTGRPWDPSQRARNVSAVVVGVLLVAFAIARNTTTGSWLAP